MKVEEIMTAQEKGGEGEWELRVRKKKKEEYSVRSSSLSSSRWHSNNVAEGEQKLPRAEDRSVKAMRGGRIRKRLMTDGGR